MFDDMSQAERAYRTLRDEILHGDLMPGERLRAADLHDRYRLGLTPIREALMRLSSESLVEAETNRGSRVSGASAAEFDDLMSTRKSIEKLCLTASMTRGDTAWEAAIVAAMHVLTRTPLPSSSHARAGAAEWERAHRRFHLALVAACGSDWLLKFWNTLADHSERYRKLRLLSRSERGNRDVNAEHRQIMEAVLARDIDRATTLMDAHLSATQDFIKALLSRAANEVVTP